MCTHLTDSELCTAQIEMCTHLTDTELCTAQIEMCTHLTDSELCTAQIEMCTHLTDSELCTAQIEMCTHLTDSELCTAQIEMCTHLTRHRTVHSTNTYVFTPLNKLWLSQCRHYKSHPNTHFNSALKQLSVSAYRINVFFSSLKLPFSVCDPHSLLLDNYP